jgi:ribosomal RNA-processing protein 12
MTRNGNTPRPGRAYLLPLIRSRTTNDSLLFFATYFRPLSERVFAKKVAADEGNRGTEAKIWEAIVGQIWDCFPGFCEMPRDMTKVSPLLCPRKDKLIRKALDTPFLSLLTNLLYNQQSLLPSLLRALSQLVNSTSRLMNSTTDAVELRKQFGMDQEDAKGNMDHLKSKAKDMVAVLLNVFAQLPRESRGMVGEVIGTWTSIMTDAVSPVSILHFPFSNVHSSLLTPSILDQS